MCACISLRCTTLDVSRKQPVDLIGHIGCEIRYETEPIRTTSISTRLVK